MQNVEVLREVKRAEAEVKRLKEEASRQAAQILRDAERRANDVIEKAKADAEGGYQASLDQVNQQVEAERQKIVKKGETEAQNLRVRKDGPQATQAVEMIIKRFHERIRG